MRKSEEILDILRRELHSGRWKENSRFPSEEQLMSRFHVSRITMNKITEQLVQEKYIVRGRGGSGAKVLNTEPFPKGQIACFCGLLHPYYSKMANGVLQHAMGLQYSVNFFSPGAELISYYLDKVAKSNYIGVLATVGVGMIPSSYPLPVVYMDSILPSEENSRCCVTCSNYRSAADMAETVISCGHKNILIFSSISPNEFSRRERLNGFVDTLKKHKIPDISRRIISIMPGNYLNFSRIFQRAYKQFPETTLILTDSDDIAFNIVEDIRAMGIEDKITVTGFGNLSWITPLLKIPTVEQHPEETGAIAVDKLIYNILHPDSPHTGNVIIDAELVNTDLIPDISNRKTDY